MIDLDLETTGSSASTSLLELASLGLDVWLLVLVWAHSEVLDSLASVLWSSEEKSVASLWCAESELIEGEGLTASLQDTGTSSGSEAESSHADLWDGQETVVIGDGSNNNDSPLLLLLDVGNDSGDGYWWAVDTAHKQAAKDDLVE